MGYRGPRVWCRAWPRVADRRGLALTADSLVVTDPAKKTLFSTSARETVIGSDKVVLSAAAGVSVK